ncbi:MAG: type II secretion system F family protein [Hahellaceae bacterium]|nr:type II secretion system F family protein [Hahellaceae bacterium]
MTLTTVATLLWCFTAFMALWPVLSTLQQGSRRFSHYLDYSAQNDWASLFLFPQPKQLLAAYFILAILALASGLLLGMAPAGATVITLLALGIPSLTLRALRQRRVLKMTHQLPDMLLSLANAMRAGAGFQTALENVVREGSPPLSQELAIILKEIKMGTSLADSFRHLESRIPTEETRLLVAAIVINREIGGSLSDVLLSLASTLRRKLEMQGKIAALTAQGRMQGYVMTALPGIIGLAVYQLEPVTMGYLFTTIWGWVVLAIACLMLMTGYVFIRKVVNIDV